MLCRFCRTVRETTRSVESRQSKGATLNELVELQSCSSCLFFECRKGKDLHLWMVKSPNGPSVKFLVNAVHTMEELKLTGNHSKGSRPILNFSSNFDKDAHLETPQGNDYTCISSSTLYTLSYLTFSRSTYW